MNNEASNYSSGPNMVNIARSTVYVYVYIQVTQKNGNFWKTQQKLKKSKKKKLLTEIEPLQLVF